MSPGEFKAVTQIIWGDFHRNGLIGAALFLRISERNAKRFACGEKEIGDGIRTALIRELGRRLADPEDRNPALVVIRSAFAHELRRETVGT